MKTDGHPEPDRRTRGIAAAVILTVVVVDFAAVVGVVDPAARSAMAVTATIGVLVGGFRLAGRDQLTAGAVVSTVGVVAVTAVAVGAILAALPGREVKVETIAVAAGAIALVAVPVAVVLIFRHLAVRRLPVRLGDVLAVFVGVAVMSAGLGGVLGAWASPRRAVGTAADSGPPDPSALGRKVYEARCAACHGSRGEGGVGPKLHAGQSKLTFPDPADQERWVADGSVSFQGRFYGDPNRPGGQQGPATGGMPGFKGMLSDEEIKAVVGYERDKL